MDCDQIREALSARLDGEDTIVDAAAIDHHLVGCGACRAWAGDIEVVHRAVRVRAADEVPDLSAAIVTSVLGQPSPVARRRARLSPLGEPISWARWGLLVVALTQVALAGPELLLRGDGDRATHVARELGAFDVALAVGLLVAAWQPARAWGLLPVVGALGLVLSGTAVLDVATGSASTFGEAHHLLDLAGVGLLWLVAREIPRARAAVPSPWLPAQR